MNILTISIGSNSNDKEKQINNCLLWIKANFDFIAVSDIYNSPATNGKDPDYMKLSQLSNLKNHTKTL